MTAYPHQHATTDGGAGAGEAGPQGQTLEQTDAERLLVADVIQGFSCDGRAELLGDDQQDAPATSAYMTVCGPNRLALIQLWMARPTTMAGIMPRMTCTSDRVA